MDQPDFIIPACSAIIDGREQPPEEISRAYFVRSAGWTRRGEAARAEADLTEAIRLKGDVAVYYAARAQARLSEDNQDGAIEDLDAAIRLDPNDPRFYLTRGVAFGKKGEFDRAIGEYDAALRLDPKNPFIHISRGVALRDKHDFAGALAEDDIAVALTPDASYGYGARCLTRAVAGIDLDKALADCDRALAYNPKDAFELASRAFVRIRQKDYATALADANACLAIEPNHSNGLLMRGLARLGLGQRAEGEADIAEAKRLDSWTRKIIVRWGLPIDPS
jgi:tetratricopeptide (TPR) repeat protein